MQTPVFVVADKIRTVEAKPGITFVKTNTSPSNIKPRNFVNSYKTNTYEKDKTIVRD